MKRLICLFSMILMIINLLACSFRPGSRGENPSVPYTDYSETGSSATTQPYSYDETEPSSGEPQTGDSSETSSVGGYPQATPGVVTRALSVYTDSYGKKAYVPANFKVSSKRGEQTVKTGLVVIGPDESEYVWIPTDETELKTRDFGSYFYSGGSLSGYSDETNLKEYKDMAASVARYGGFYIGRYEASKGSNGLPLSKRVSKTESGNIWVRFSPQDTVTVCQNLYPGNNTVQGFFPWGANWDTMLQWLIDTGCKTANQVSSDSSSWGNYSNDTFSPNAGGNYTGIWEEANSNNIYDLAGNNWEWTQERYGTNYVMRGGGYNLMGGSCPGNTYPAAIRDPLPGNDHHPNVTFRAALYVK